jgi:hypothetical protein
VLANLIIKSASLKSLDIGYNGIEGKSIYCLSSALAINKGIEYISMEGNPLGKVGLGLLMKAKSINSS